jgi:CRP/FNR family transcriptional regulator
MALPQDLNALLPASFLAELPADDVESILASEYRIEQDAGRAFGMVRDEPVVALVLEGLVRVFLDSGAGREVTVRYARPGDALGLVHLLATRTEVSLAAVTPTQLWVVRGAALLPVLGRSTPLALAVARECAARTADAMDELALAFFGSVKARLARHLLDLASSQPQSGALVAAVTQQQLADAQGLPSIVIR